VPFLVKLAEEERGDLSLRRAALRSLAGVDDENARAYLQSVLWTPGLAPVALHELRRLRQAGKLPSLGSAALAPLLRSEAERSLFYASAAARLQQRSRALGERARLTAEELNGLRDQGVQRAMDLLALVHDPERVRAIEQGLATHDPNRRSSALELLEGMLDYHDSGSVLLLCETVAEGGQAAAPAWALERGTSPDAPLDGLRADREWFPHALALYVLVGANSPAAAPDALTAEEREMIPLIQKVMVLKGSELFRALPGEELAGVALLATEAYLEEGEVLFRQGEEGDAFYVVVSGSVRILRDGREVARLGAREGFGEMAILDHGPRSATAQAAEPTALLRLERDNFDRLVDRNPAVAKGIYRVLSRRLRSTLAQVGTA
jgi:hypothetical protein